MLVRLAVRNPFPPPHANQEACQYSSSSGMADRSKLQAMQMLYKLFHATASTASE